MTSYTARNKNLNWVWKNLIQYELYDITMPLEVFDKIYIGENGGIFVESKYST